MYESRDSKTKHQQEDTWKFSPLVLLEEKLYICLRRTIAGFLIYIRALSCVVMDILACRGVIVVRHADNTVLKNFALYPAKV